MAAAVISMRGAQASRELLDKNKLQLKDTSEICQQISAYSVHIEPTEESVSLCRVKG